MFSPKKVLIKTQGIKLKHAQNNKNATEIQDTIDC